MSWIWRSCSAREHLVLTQIQKTGLKHKNIQKEAYKPVLHSQPQLSVSDGSPHLLGCGHVWAWPPELLALSQPWWAPPYTHSDPARVSAIYDGCPQSSTPSEWTLTKTKNGNEYWVCVCTLFYIFKPQQVLTGLNAIIENISLCPQVFKKAVKIDHSSLHVLLYCRKCVTYHFI